MLITDEIEIEAPAEVVWEIAIDADRLEDWVPGFEQSSRSDGGGPFVVGSRARIKQAGLPVTEWTAQEVGDGHRFVWSTKVRGMTLVATHTVSPSTTAGRVVNRLDLDATGRVMTVLGPLVKGRLVKQLAAENAALKARAEAAAG
jgi:hypothetical protein